MNSISQQPHANGQPLFKIRIEPSPRWVRVQLGGRWIADSKNTLLVMEPGSLPVYYFPRKDVAMELLERSDKHSSDDSKGEAVYWHVKAGGRFMENAARSYERPGQDNEAISGYIAFKWGAMDKWYEEEMEVYKHARDPYTRVDAIRSSRHIKVIAGGEVIAESRSPVLVFETGLAVRYYIPASDIRMDLLVPSSTITRCPYKGLATYWSIRVNDTVYNDIVWSYNEPNAEVLAIRGLLSFYNEAVELYVDGVKWSLPAEERLPYSHIAEAFL